MKMNTIYKLLAALLFLPVVVACSDDDYKANVTELRLVRVTPTNVYSGDIVTILGRNFSLETEENVVTIDGVAAEVIEAKRDELSIILPKLDPGEHTISVTAPSGSLSGLILTYLKKPDREYLVQTIVGQKGVATCIDGMGTDATTKLPTGLAFAPDGSIWFTDRGFNKIRRISPDFEVTTVAEVELGGSAIWQGNFNSKGEYFFIDKAKGMLRKLNADGKATTVASGMKSPMNVCFDKNDNMYVSARDNKAIYKFTPDGGTRTTFATLEVAPNYCTFDLNGNLIVGCNGYVMYQVTPDGTVSTICGDGTKHDVYYDGEPGNMLTAHIGPTFGICAAPDGSLYYSDNRYNVIRRLVPGEDGRYVTGTLETVIGTGSRGYADGAGLKAALNQPYELLMTTDGKTMYIAGAVNYVIRKVSIK